MAYLGRYCTYLVCVVHKMKKHGVRINFEQIIFASSDLALSSNECCSCVYIVYTVYTISYYIPSVKGYLRYIPRKKPPKYASYVPEVILQRMPRSLI